VFVFVLSGAVVLHINEQAWKLKKGECFYYTAASPYFLENNKGNPAVVLWVTSPPNF
jgi:mannose-6-phosphate isomerase-like protein (cupin superfamily)